MAWYLVNHWDSFSFTFHYALILLHFMERVLMWKTMDKLVIWSELSNYFISHWSNSYLVIYFAFVKI